MTIGNNIREYRAGKNLTQQELANAVAVSRQTIIALEKGNYLPSLMLGLQLANFFHTEVERLFFLKK